MSIYFDASAVMPNLIDEPASAQVVDFLRSAPRPWVVSEFAAAEVASALSRLVRTREIPAAAAASARLAEFDQWRVTNTETIDIGDRDLRLASVFVRRFDLMLRAPDALHAALCKRGGLRLVTLDRRLATAAEALGVQVKLLG